MYEKQNLIAKMIEMQKKFIQQQRKSGVSAREYFLPEDDEALHGYQEEYQELATQVLELAHRERGSSQ